MFGFYPAVSDCHDAKVIANVIAKPKIYFSWLILQAPCFRVLFVSISTTKLLKPIADLQSIRFNFQLVQ